MEQLTDATIAAWTGLMRTSRVLLERVETALKSAGFPPLSWYDVLLEIEMAGAEGLRPYELTDKLLLPQYGTSRLLERIVKAGLVERVACAEDRRGQVLRLTEAGRRMRRRMWPVYARALGALVEDRLDESEARQLATLLNRLRGGEHGPGDP